MPDLTQQATAERDPFLGKGSPSKQQWKLFQPNPHPFRAIFLDLWIPWKLFAFPIVELAAFIVSWSCSSFLTINLTQSQNFAAPPYNFNSQSIGFHELCHFGRRADRAGDCGSFERLGQRESNEEERRYSRAGDEIACYE
jgi:hypothetical protein